MQGNREIGTHQEMLMSTLLMLVSFAAMAERAARMPRTACLEMLRFLRPSELVGLRLVAGAAHELAVPLPPEACLALLAPLTERTSDQLEAERLAERFRLLAVILMAMLTQAGRFTRQLARRAAVSNAAGATSRSAQQIDGVQLRGRPRSQAQFFDTS